MPYSPLQPEPANPPPTRTEGGGSGFDHLEVQIKALQQEALATQNTIKQLQAREAPDPWSVAVTELRALPSLPALPAMDMSMLGAMVVLSTLMVVMWWYLWHRPQSRTVMHIPVDPGDSQPSPVFAAVTPRTAKAEAAVAAPQPRAVERTPEPTWHPQPEPEPVRRPAPVAVPLPEPVLEEKPTPIQQAAPVFARPEPSFGFDSEAAASEVMRVRKSLAEKREARSLLLEYEDEQPAEMPPPPAGVSAVPQASGRKGFEHQPLPSRSPQPAPEVALALEPVSPGVVEPESVSDLGIAPEAGEEEHAEAMDLSAVLDAQLPAPPEVPEPDAEPESNNTPSMAETEPPPEQPDPTAHGSDYSITLALAKESAALDLWTEARELANEVLEQGDATLHDEARALLEHIDAHEQHMQQEAEAQSRLDAATPLS